MGTILRSSRYIRCLNVLARRTVVGHDNANFASKCLALRARCTNSYLTKSYATIPAIQRRDPVNDFHKDIEKLDDNVQRYGRVDRIDVESILAKVRNAGFISSLDGLLLLRCCGELLGDSTPTIRSDMVQQVWETLEILKIPMDVSHFNALLRVYLENNYKFSPIEILTEMKNKMIEPNRVTYQRLILYYCKKGDIEEATKILEFMKEKNIPLSESVFTALIIGHSEADNMESANNILKVMKDAEIAPSSSTYTALLTAYAKRGDTDSIKRIVSDCEKTEIYLHDKEFFEVIEALAANGHSSAIDEVLPMTSKSSSYNYDACHAILKVLDAGNVAAALKILSTMKKRKKNEAVATNETDSGTFLIKKLINSKFPPATVIHVCELMEKEGYHTKAFSVALERSLGNGDVTLSIPLLKAWKERGGEIREHFVWPILVVYGKAGNFQGIEDTLRLMSQDLNVVIGAETVIEYVLPYAIGKWNDIITSLKINGIPTKTVIDAIARRILRASKTRLAATFMKNYSSNYDVHQFDRLLANAFAVTTDTQSCATILRIILNSELCRPEPETSGEGSPDQSGGASVIDIMVQKIVEVFPRHKFLIMDEFLDELITGGMGISPEVGEALRQYFGDNLTPETNEKIDKLTSGTLVLAPMSDYDVRTDETVENGDDDQGILINSQFSGKRQQLASILASRDVEALKDILENLTSMDFKFSAATYAQIIQVFCESGDSENAEIWMKKFRSEYNDVGLDFQKTMKYASVLIQNNRFDDALQFICDWPRKEKPISLGTGFRRLLRELLEVAVQTGNVEKTNALWKALETNKYLIPDNVLLGSLVKVHFVNDDIEGALNAYENACHTYNYTPMKNDLAKKLIDAEDAVALQRLTDLSTEIHGENNSLIDLVLSFVECGRLRQARKIMETPGLKLSINKFKVTALHYTAENKRKVLKDFFDLTKGLPLFDRQELYNVLLNVYKNRNDWQQSLNLWMEMQDENIQPSQTFLTTLADLLNRNDQPIPFVPDAKNNRINGLTPKYVFEFNNAIAEGDLETATAIFETAPKNDPHLSTVASTLIMQLLEQRKDVDKAYDVARMMLVTYTRQIRTTALKDLWSALINDGQFDKLRNLDKELSNELKVNLRFHKFLSRANMTELGVVTVLSNLEAKLTDSKAENLNLVKNELHFTAILNELKRDPSFLPQLMSLAEKLCAQGIYLPMNIVWVYYFEQNDPKADEIYSKHLVQSEWIVFNHLLKVSKNTNNVGIAERLHYLLADNDTVLVKAKAKILEFLLNTYRKDGRYDDAFKLLENTSSHIISSVKNHTPECIHELMDAARAAGKSI